MKLAADEALPAVMETMGYEQSFTLADIKLALGYGTVAIAALLYLLDKKYPFEQTFYASLALVVVYGIISIVMYYLNSSAQYKNTAYVGYDKSKKKISVHTWSTKYDPIYNVKIVLEGRTESAAAGEIPFNKFFDQFGYLNREQFTKLINDVTEKKAQ